MSNTSLSFTEFLKSKIKFIVIYFGINLFALFVNLFGIEGILNVGNRECRTCQTESSIHLFTDNYYTDRFEESKQSNFWPFSGLTRTKIFGNYNERKANIFSSVSAGENKIINFCGIFFMYDYSEFLAYLLLLLFFYFFKWENGKSKL